MSVHRFSHKNVLNPNNKPTACVVRYGAFGDTVQAMSVVTELAKTHHITFICQHPGSELVIHDPSIDRLIVQTQNQVPIGQLGQFWSWWEMHGAPGGKRYDRWINLTESVESNLLISAGNVKFVWAPKARHQFMNHNYLEFQHKIGNVPYVPTFKFYPTEQEIRWRNEERSRMRKAGIDKFILWALAGSSRTHKVYPHSDAVWAHVIKYYPGWGILAAGDPSCVELEKKWAAEPRIWCTSSRYTMRQVLTMLGIADVIVGPETGTMSAAAFYPQPKVVFLSHSTIENLTRDWVSCCSMWAPYTECPGRGKKEDSVPACHLMLPTFEGCRRHEQTGVAQCSSEIDPADVWKVLQHCMNQGVAPKWDPVLKSISSKDAPTSGPT